MSIRLIASFVFAFHEVHKGLIYHTVAERSRIITGKIPVAQVVGTGEMQMLNGLINDAYFGTCFRGVMRRAMRAEISSTVKGL